MALGVVTYFGDYTCTCTCPILRSDQSIQFNPSTHPGPGAHDLKSCTRSSTWSVNNGEKNRSLRHPQRLPRRVQRDYSYPAVLE